MAIGKKEKTRRKPMRTPHDKVVGARGDVFQAVGVAMAPTIRESGFRFQRAAVARRDIRVYKRPKLQNYLTGPVKVQQKVNISVAYYT
jgi:hypothetical protein